MIANLGAAIFVECWVNILCFSCVCLNNVIIHLNSRNKSYKISEALGDDFRAKFRQQSAFQRADFRYKNQANGR